MRIDVNQEIIDEAHNQRKLGKSIVRCCPLALAFQKYFPRAKVYLRDNKFDYAVVINDVQYPLPSEACFLADNFDRGLPVSPISFDFDLLS